MDMLVKVAPDTASISGPSAASLFERPFHWRRNFSVLKDDGEVIFRVVAPQDQQADDLVFGVEGNQGVRWA